jgi:molybdopterin synthase sulfur carrier subunit
MNVVYFASVRQALGKSEETISMPATITTVAGLAAFLAAQGPAYAAVFTDTARLRVAVNQVHARFEDLVGDADEVAFFPPVTGG